MLIRCERLRLLMQGMELDLQLDGTTDRRFVTDKFTEWGYDVISVKEGPADIPNLVTILVRGNDHQGIIDKMCDQPEFDVKC